jgi:hypothetical protein
MRMKEFEAKYRKTKEKLKNRKEEDSKNKQ